MPNDVVSIAVSGILKKMALINNSANPAVKRRIPIRNNPFQGFVILSKNVFFIFYINECNTINF